MPAGLTEQEELAELAGQEDAAWPGELGAEDEAGTPRELGAEDEAGTPSNVLVGDDLGKSKAALGFGRLFGVVFPTAPTPENHCWAQDGAEGI